MSLTLPSTDGSTTPARKQVLVFRELPPDQLARLTAVHDVTVADPRKPDERARFGVTDSDLAAGSDAGGGVCTVIGPSGE